MLEFPACPVSFPRVALPDLENTAKSVNLAPKRRVAQTTGTTALQIGIVLPAYAAKVSCRNLAVAIPEMGVLDIL